MQNKYLVLSEEISKNITKVYRVKYYYFLTIIIWLTLTSCNSLKIIDKPIIFNDERAQLTIEYLGTRYGLVQNEPIINPKMVVVHRTAIPTFEKSFAILLKKLLIYYIIIL